MDAIDWLLNLACVLLWLNWRAIRFIRVAPAIGISLAGTLRRAEPARSPRWSSLAALLAILFTRSLFYVQIGSAVSWIPRLELGAMVLTFRSDRFSWMLLYSFLGFGVWLCGLYAWLLLLSAVNSGVADTDPWQRLIRVHLASAERLPGAVKLLLPTVAVFAFWMAIHPLLIQQELLPRAQSPGRVFGQAALLGLSVVLYWRPLIVGILALHVINTYVYLGRMPFWEFVSTTAKNLLKPWGFLRLRLGLIDLAPLAGILVVVVASEIIRVWLPRIYQLL